VRDVEASLADALGPQAALSKSTVARICQAIKNEFAAWTQRDLGDVELDYLYLDGSHFKMDAGARAEPVLVAWGITTCGSPVLLGLTPAAGEAHDAWADFLGGLVDRGLRAPVLVISDGAPGLIGAAEVVFPHSLRQRCLVHRARTCSPRSPSAPRPRSRPRSGRFSTTSTSQRARPQSTRRPTAPRRSPTATSACTHPRSPA
jgi:putative transposase